MSNIAEQTRLDDDDPFMKVDEIAAYGRVHSALIYRAMADGRLPYSEIGPRSRRVRRSDVVKFFAPVKVG